jgi:hypothetical protein
MQMSPYASLSQMPPNRREIVGVLCADWKRDPSAAYLLLEKLVITIS